MGLDGSGRQGPRGCTTTLFAALDVLEGKVIGRCMQRSGDGLAHRGRPSPSLPCYHLRRRPPTSPITLLSSIGTDREKAAFIAANALQRVPGGQASPPPPPPRLGRLFSSAPPHPGWQPVTIWSWEEGLSSRSRSAVCEGWQELDTSISHKLAKGVWGHAANAVLPPGVLQVQRGGGCERRGSGCGTNISGRCGSAGVIRWAERVSIIPFFAQSNWRTVRSGVPTRRGNCAGRMR
jgi:hypothetical protein